MRCPTVRSLPGGGPEDASFFWRRSGWCCGGLPADTGDLADLDGDPQVVRFLGDGKPVPRGVIENDTLPRLLRSYGCLGGSVVGPPSRSPRTFLWDGSPSTRRKAADRKGPNSDTGRAVLRGARGTRPKGSRVLIREDFNELGVRRVFAETMAVNAASRRVMEKAGPMYARTFHSEWKDPLPGTEDGEVEYASMEANWKQQEAVGYGVPPSEPGWIKHDARQVAR